MVSSLSPSRERRRKMSSTSPSIGRHRRMSLTSSSRKMQRSMSSASPSRQRRRRMPSRSPYRSQIDQDVSSERSKSSYYSKYQVKEETEKGDLVRKSRDVDRRE